MANSPTASMIVSREDGTEEVIAFEFGGAITKNRDTMTRGEIRFTPEN